MSLTCVASGIWDQVRQAPFMSPEQWQASHLLILCEILTNNGIVPSMSACTVAGLWDQVKGNPPFLSAQQFYAEDLNLLCQLVGGGGGGGVTPAGTDLWGDYAGPGDPPAGFVKPFAHRLSDEMEFANHGTVAAPIWIVI